jgi:indolepyruvate ferredoxin oxidoreductase
MNAPFSDKQLQALNAVKLDDKYDLASGRAWLSGVHALVRLPMNQRVRDQRDGLNTAGFISGYRGSPLGGLDQNLWKAAERLKQHHVVFQPGVNEDSLAFGTEKARVLIGVVTCLSTPMRPAPHREAAC